MFRTNGRMEYRIQLIDPKGEVICTEYRNEPHCWITSIISSCNFIGYSAKISKRTNKHNPLPDVYGVANCVGDWEVV